MPDPIIPNAADPSGVAGVGTGVPAAVDPPAVDPPAVDPPAVDPPAVDPPASSDPAAAAAARVAQAVKDAEGTAKWYEGLPETLHEKLSGFENEEAMIKAIEKGTAVNPATATTDYAIDLGKNEEGVEINTLDDGGSLDRYKGFCLDEDISPEKAQKLIDFQKDELETAETANREAGELHLKKVWGNKIESNKQEGLNALALIDRRLGGRVGPVAKQQGWAKDPFLVEILHEVSKMVGEDSLGAAPPGGGDPDAPVSSEEAYSKLYKAAQKE